MKKALQQESKDSIDPSMMAEPATTLNYSQSRYLNLSRSFNDSQRYKINYEFVQRVEAYLKDK